MKRTIDHITRLLLVVVACLGMIGLVAPSRPAHAAPTSTMTQSMQPAPRLHNDSAQGCPSYVSGCVMPGGPQVMLGTVSVICGSYCGPVQEIDWSTSTPPSWLNVTLKPTITYTYTDPVSVSVQAASNAPVGMIGSFYTFCDVIAQGGARVGCSNSILWSVQVLCKPNDPGCVQLKILDVEPGSPTNGQDISYNGASIQKIVGQHIQLAVVASNGQAVSNIQWSVPGAGTSTPTSAIKSYALPNPTTPPYTTTPPSLHPEFLLPGDLQSTTVAFYWVQPNILMYQWGQQSSSPYVLSVSGMVDGRAAGATAEYTVAAPDAQGLFTNQASMYSLTSVVGIGCCFKSNGDHWLSLGDNTIAGMTTPGISFTNFSATAPPNGQGELAATQLISVTATQTTITGTTRTCISTGSDPVGGYWIDNNALYPRYGIPGTPAPYVSISSGAYASWSSRDVPKKALAAPTSYTATFAFKIYMLYRPNGADSIWVPLGLLTWSFGGTATNDGATGWKLASATNPNPPNPTGVPTSEFPAWDNVLNNGSKAFKC